MFFSERIVSINSNYKVLEVGPGATPHIRSNVFLEKRFDTEEELIAQSGKVGLLKTDKKVVLYDGAKFPFEDKEFDYVICSHVLEHVPDVAFFLSELQRIASKGYLEYPTIYYDYIYDIPEHENFLLKKDGVIYWMKKNQTNIHEFKIIQRFFYTTMNYKYTSLVNELKDYFFQGFEWDGEIKVQSAMSLDDVCFSQDMISLRDPTLPFWKRKLINLIKRI